MSLYTLNVFGLSDATTNVADILAQALSGDQWEWNLASNPDLTVDAAATPTRVEIDDSDGARNTLDDDSTGQVTTTAVTIDGITYPPGTEIQDEYEVTMTDGIGGDFRLIAISTRVYTDPYTFNDQVIGFTWEGAVPPQGVTLSYVAGSVQDYALMVPCFTAGTRIATPSGARPVEALRAGDAVLTRDGQPHRLIWTGRRQIGATALDAAPNLRPIRISAGALGPGVPDRDLVISPQHRVLVRSSVARRMFGVPEVLVAAKHLLGAPGIAPVRRLQAVIYVHLLCDSHQILIANGAETESLYLGKSGIQGLGLGARHELRRLVPGFVTGTPPHPARPLIPGRPGRKLTSRHLRNAKAFQ